MMLQPALAGFENQLPGTTPEFAMPVPKLPEAAHLIGSIISSKLAIAALAGTVGLVGGAIAAISGNLGDHTHTQYSVSTGHGKLLGTYIMPAKICHGGYITRVDDATARWRYQVKAFGVTQDLANMSQTFDGDVTAQICNTGSSEQITEDANGKYELNISAADLVVDVFRTDLTANVFKTGNNIIGGKIKNFDNDLSGFGLTGGTGFSDGTNGKLQGLAELQAYQVAATGCGPTAWEHIKGQYVSEVEKDVLSQHPDLKEEDLIVNVPDQVAFKTQYNAQLQKAKAEATGKRTSITWSGTPAPCQDDTTPRTAA